MLNEHQINMLPERVYQRLQAINTEYLESIGKTIKKIGELRPTDVYKLQSLYNYGADVKAITRKLFDISGKNIKDIKDAFDIVAKENYNFSKPFYEATGKKFIPYEKNETLQRYVNSLAQTTVNEYMNITQHTAFSVFQKDGKSIAPLFYENKDKVATSLSDTYTKIVDYAVTKAQMGGDYQSAMREIIRAMANSGIKTVDYATGYSRRLDTAVRQNVLWGIKQCNQNTADMIGKDFGADGYEISYHSHPRPSHADMGGKQFAIGKARTVNGVYYPSFEEKAQSLLDDFGCLHFKFSILLGVSEPTYSKEQLEAFKNDDNKKITFEGKEYTKYEASQLQRKIESRIRYEKDLANMAKASGDDDLRREAQSKINQLTNKYNKLCNASGLPTQKERMSVSGFRSVKEKSQLKNFKNIDNTAKSGIIKTRFTQGSIFEKAEYNPEDIQQAIIQKGTNFVTQNINSNEYGYGVAIESVKPLEGIYDIKAHGDYDGVKIFDTAVDAKELARIILSRKDYIGQPIRLLSCNTGKLAKGTCVGQELADLLGVEVFAPNDIVVTDGKGLLRVGKSRFKDTGEFISFKPK